MDIKALREICDPLNKAVTGKCPWSGGHSKRNCLKDRSNNHRSRTWQIVLNSTTGGGEYVECLIFLWLSFLALSHCLNKDVLVIENLTTTSYKWKFSFRIFLRWSQIQIIAMTQLDMSMARWHLKLPIPKSLSGTSTHPTMVFTHRSRSWPWTIDSHPFRPMSITALPPK